jgi:phage-related holin
MDFQHLLDVVVLALRAFFTFPEVKFLLAHVSLNTVVAIATALRDNSFDLRKLSEFLTKKLLPNILVYAIVRIIGSVLDMAWLSTIAWAAITAALTGDLMDNLAKLGLKIPEKILHFVGVDPE